MFLKEFYVVYARQLGLLNKKLDFYLSFFQSVADHCREERNFE